METGDGLITAHSINEASGFSGYTRGYTVGHYSCLLDDERILELMIFLGLLSPLLTNVTFFHWPDISTAVSPCLLADYSADLQRATKGRNREVACRRRYNKHPHVRRTALDPA